MANFLENKYSRWYFSIVESRREKGIPEGYSERHHVIPHSLGGDKSPENYFRFTAREHFLLHWLLTKFTVGQDRLKMLGALGSMCCRKTHRKFSSWHYERARKAFSERMKVIAKERVGSKNSFYGKKHKLETIEIMRQQKLGAAHPFYGIKRPEHGEKVSKALSGKAKSEEHKKNLAKTWQSSRVRVRCFNCNLETTKSMNTRWHGDKCRRYRNG